MKLLMVSASFEGGGAERQLAQMANYWASRGWLITAVTWKESNARDFYWLDERIHRAYLPVAARPGYFGTLAATLIRVVKLRALIRRVRPDVVLSFVAENNVLTILATVGLGVRVIVSERAHPANDSTVPRVWMALRKGMYRWCDGVVAQTQTTADWVERNFRIATRVIPNALRSFEDMGMPESRECLIVSIGRLSTQKGFDVLLQAFAKIADRFPEWNVVILGAGDERDNLLRLCSKLGLMGRVKFAGQVRAVEEWMSRAGLVVQPSRFEGFPNVVLEAMAMGAAVISADCLSGPSDLIDDGVNGRLVPVDDVEALATTMARMMSEPDTRARLGLAAMKVRELFGEDRIMPLWEAALLPEQSSTVHCSGE